MKTILEYLKRREKQDYSTEQFNGLQVGDEIKIKSEDWYNSMKKNYHGEIELDGYTTVFSPDMKHLCGKWFKIKEVFTNIYGKSPYICYRIEDKEQNTTWSITTWMIDDFK